MGRVTSERGLTIALVVASAVALLQTVRIAWARWSRRRRIVRRARRARDGELDAERLLRRAGYRITGRQVEAELTYGRDGDAVRVTVRADLLVRRGGRAFVAEVKTGPEATRLSTPATRRQLLEYAHAFAVDGVLLVDPEAARVSVVEVPARPAPPRARPGRDLAWVAIGAVLGAAALAWWRANG